MRVQTGGNGMGQKGEDAAEAEEDGAQVLHLNKWVGELGQTSRSEIASPDLGVASVGVVMEGVALAGSGGVT